MKKNKFYFTFLFTMISIYIISIPRTNGKFQIVNFGIAWENYFTEFEQLQSVFYITDLNGETDTELFGLTTSGDENLVLREDGFYVTKESWVDGSTNSYEEYALDTLQGIEFNVANQTPNDMIIVFVLHFYSPKRLASNDWSISGIRYNYSFGIFNTYIHDPENTEVNLNTSSTATSVLKGEFIVNTGGQLYSNSQYDYLPEVVCQRLSGGQNGEHKIGGDWFGTTYYTHLAIINPYAILYNLKDGEAPIPYNNSEETTNNSIEDKKNEDGDPASYVYPAHDYETGVNANTSTISNPDLLDEFILIPGEAASFNVNLFCGDYGATTASDNYSFISSVDMYAFPVESMEENLEKIRNKEVIAHKLPSLS